MANEADLKLIQIPEFPKTDTLVGSGPEYVVLTKADGVTYGMLTEDFKAFLGTVQVQVPKALAPTDPAPTLSGVYYPTVTQNEAGTPIVYANAGGIEVNTAEGGEDYGKQVQLIQDNEGGWSKIGIPLPEPDLSGLATKEDLSVKLDASKVVGTRISNQLFDKNSYEHSSINSTGELVPSSTSATTLPIEWGSNEAFTASGMAAGQTHRVITRDAGGVIKRVLTFTEATKTITKEEGEFDFRVWFQNSTNVIDAFMLNFGTSSLPYEPYKERLLSVDGKETTNPDTLIKKTDVTVQKTVTSDQKFNKTEYLTGRTLSSAGRLSVSTNTDSLVTLPLPLYGAKNWNARGMLEGVNKRFAFWKTPAGASSDVVATQPFTSESIGGQVPDEANYLVLWFRNGSESDDPSAIQASLDSLVINFSEEELPKDDYSAFDEVAKIGDAKVVTSNDIGNGGGGGGISEIPQSIDDRFEQLSYLYSEDSIVSKNSAFVNSLRRLSDSPAVLKTINIPNALGTVQKDVIVPIHLYNHAGSDVANGFNHVFLDGLVNNDFSDIRAFANGEMLDMSIESSGNYSAFPIPFANPRTVDIIFEDGLYFITGSSGIQSSPDLVNWTNILTDVTLAFVDADGNVYGKKLGQLPLFKFYKSTGYTTEKQVISVPGAASSVWRYKNFIVDIFGHIYVGSYQEEFLTYIYKSTDMGETFTAVFTPSLSDSQHCHNLVIDKTVTPNIIYASFDGNGSEPGKRSQWISKDYAATWTRSDLDNKLGGISVDSGIAHADGNLLIGVSEGAIKGTPSIYTSLNQGKSFDIHLWGQNTHTVYQLGDLYLIAGTANKANKDSILWGTYDLVNIFPINQTTYLENASSTGWGYRYGSYHPIPDPEGGDCIIMTATSAGTPPALKLKVGEDYYSALVYVKVPELPAGGINIEIRNGFLIGEPYHDFFNDDVTGEAYRFPLNERVSKLPYAELTDNPRWFVTNGLGRVRTSTSSRNMRELQGMLKLTDFGIDEQVDLAINSTKGISTSFWFGRELTGSTPPTQAILQIGDILIEASTTLRMTVFGEVFTVSGAMIPNTVKKPNLFTATISKGQLSVYVNNNLMGQFPIVANADRIINSLKVGDAMDLTPKQDVYISDLRIYDRVLSYSDVNIMYNRANLYNR